MKHEEFKAEYSRLKEKAIKIALAVKDFKAEDVNYISFDIDYEDEGNEINVEWELPSGCGCCAGEMEYFNMKIENLYNLDADEYIKKIIKEREEEEMKRKVEFLKREKADKEARVKAEKEEYERLKEKYEND